MPSSSRHPYSPRGFKLIELTAGIALLFIIATVSAQYTKSRDSSREEEVKANLREIQVALERYAIDSGGLYPLMLYGGAPSDTFATTKSKDVSEFPGDVDWLLEADYLEQYPRNPFRRGLSGHFQTDPGTWLDPSKHLFRLPNGDLRSRLLFWSNAGTRGHADRSQQNVRRDVGGPTGNLMWDVSEGHRHIPYPAFVVPDDGFNPGIPREMIGGTFKDDHHSLVTAGNFYYYPLLSDAVGTDTYLMHLSAPPSKFASKITGYRLMGYGAPGNPALDAYYPFGDDVANTFGTYPVNDTQFGIGPDGRRDGVILTLPEGWE